ILGRKGYNLAVARNGREALELVSEKVPDAMILDLMMPEVDGFAVLDALRSNPDTANIPVIVATAKELTVDEKSRLQGQIQSLMTKGDFLNDEFLDEVRSLIR
ncbi:MAG TPA: response regulator, partial [Gammaproteobacteria bacterium]|nr:response regulator [Gammaproteobacteria bacterium]